MIFRYCILILFSTACINVNGGVFKCVNEKGGITFQQRPCDKNSLISEKINIATTTNRSPVEINSKNKKLSKLAHFSDAIRITADQCKKLNSSYSQEIEQAATRLFEIRREEVEAGNDILKRGFRGLSPNEIASLRRTGRAKLIAKMSKMSKVDLDKFCDSEGRKARRIAARSTKRSSGYKEGDIDPEGND